MAECDYLKIPEIEEKFLGTEEKMIENFKRGIAEKPTGIVVMDLHLLQEET